jgi:hypothetical protein
MKSRIFIVVVFGLLAGVQCSERDQGPRFIISYTKELSEQAQDGRLLLLLANNNTTEPRFQITDGLSTQLVFGIDVDGFNPGQEITIDGTAFGFPKQSLNDIPAGEYFVQAQQVRDI